MTAVNPGGDWWPDVWQATADQLERYRAAGLQALMTEDVLRFAVVQELVKVGVAPKDIEAEWRRPGVPDAVDLVVTRPTSSAIEFKFPREPRETNAAWTQHLGEVLKDIYRLAHMPIDFVDRWCVQLLSNRMIRYLNGVADRYGVRLGMRPGEPTLLEPGVVRGLPGTATRALERWQSDTTPVRAVCHAAHPVGNELRLVTHLVAPAKASDP